ncbi:hypothetical protein Cgig2_007426 [Carnegiea gigantea]|uniref:Uncharacterized protein n=1 Tax=Carnegiea gigantea TaxID=171969 RepID=A0A9Q1KYK7_9CARY|nr:hypothetical protein Cgig2_007426 [Carnegiea gigantea]
MEFSESVSWDCLNEMAAEEHADLSALKSHLSGKNALWKKEMEQCESRVDALQEKFVKVKASIEGSEVESGKELDVLWRRVKTAATVLTYLKARARIMAVPHLAQASCGIKQLEGVGLVDKDGIPLCNWSKSIDLSSFGGLDGEACIGTSNQNSPAEKENGAYVDDLLNSAHMVTNVMEALVKRVIIAESETAIEKEKVSFGKEEIKKKETQLESMSLKLEEMERFAFGTNCILNEMRQRVEDLVEETSRQRQRATENEQELTRVKRDFESLKSYVSSLISVRETLISSEKQFQTIEKLFERGFVVLVLLHPALSSFGLQVVTYISINSVYLLVLVSLLVVICGPVSLPEGVVAFKAGGKNNPTGGRENAKGGGSAETDGRKREVARLTRQERSPAVGHERTMQGDGPQCIQPVVR